MTARRRREDDDQENPAWPGLVDVFAFGMVIMLLLWARASVPIEAESTAPPPTVAELLEQEANRVTEDLLAEFDNSVTLERRGTTIEVTAYRNRQVYFDTGRYDLAPADRAVVQELGAIVARNIADRPQFVVLVNGTADPTPLMSAVPPRNNVELSALRAAGVSQILTQGGLEGRVQVVGLGETGTNSGQSSAELREFRRVYLTLQVMPDRLQLPVSR